MLPLLANAHGSQTLVWHQGRAVTREAFINSARSLAPLLPPAAHVINLTVGRLSFMLGFAAALLRNQITLLPPNQTPAALADVKQRYPDHYVLDDAQLQAWEERKVATGPIGEQSLALPADEVRVVLFTSGSTGVPQAQPKTWQVLARTGELDAARFTGELASRFRGCTLNLVATVPSQHMFGLQTTVLLPFWGDCAIHDSRPFFPADIRDALLALPAPRALVSTPVHLRACLASNIALPPVEFVLSATAAMPLELAHAVEQRWQAPVLEIYGSTEAGTMGTRRTTQGDCWRLLPGARLRSVAEGWEYQGPHLPGPVSLSDRLALISPDEFRLLGRAADQIKIAGKRASLSELTHALLSIAGVQDGCVFQAPDTQRTAALVVAPHLTAAHILDELAKRVDAVFLPRPLVLVPQLPRNAVGKLTQAALLAALPGRSAT